jgi:hypothetical protein
MLGVQLPGDFQDDAERSTDKRPELMLAQKS